MKAIEKEGVRRAIEAMLKARGSHSGRGEKVRKWIRAAAEAFLAGEDIPMAPDVETAARPRRRKAETTTS